MIGISNKQGEMLAFIKTFVAENGYPPTYEEIRAGLDISTKSLVNYHLQALEDAALLTRIPNTPRGLRLTYGSNVFPVASGPSANGIPVETTTLNHNEIIELTYGAVTNNNNMYALKVTGDTMIDAQATEGDVVILQRQTQIENGEMVAIRLLDRDETKLKRYYRENGHVRLESTNAAMEALILKPDAVEIQGKVVAVIRQVD